MQVLPIFNNFELKPNFKAGKIRVLNQQFLTDAELKAIANNDEFKKMATKLKRKDADLFLSVDKNMSNINSRSLTLSSRVKDKPEKIIDIIKGAIYQVVPEKSSLIDNITVYPAKMETLFIEDSSKFQKEKYEMYENLRQRNIVISDDLGSWHYSELKAIQDNENFTKLAQEHCEYGESLFLSKEYSDFLDINYIEIRYPEGMSTTIIPTVSDIGSSYSLTDVITKFDASTFLSSSKTRDIAISEIEGFNAQQDVKGK